MTSRSTLPWWSWLCSPWRTSVAAWHRTGYFSPSTDWPWCCRCSPESWCSSDSSSPGWATSPWRCGSRGSCGCRSTRCRWGCRGWCWPSPGCPWSSQHTWSCPGCHSWCGPGWGPPYCTVSSRSPPGWPSPGPPPPPSCHIEPSRETTVTWLSWISSPSTLSMYAWKKGGVVSHQVVTAQSHLLPLVNPRGGLSVHVALLERDQSRVRT